MLGSLPPIQQERRSFHRPKDAAPKAAAPKAAAPKAAAPKATDAIKNPVNILKLSYNNISETKLKLLKKSITNINYNLLYFFSHHINDNINDHINFSVNSDNLLSLFVSKYKIILYDIYNFINTEYRSEFNKVLTRYKFFKHNSIGELYKKFKKNARNKIIGLLFYDFRNNIELLAESAKTAIENCRIEVIYNTKGELDGNRITSSLDRFLPKSYIYKIDINEKTFKIDSNYDIKLQYRKKISEYIEANSLDRNNNSDDRIITLNKLDKAIEKLNGLRDFYNFAYVGDNTDDNIKIINYTNHDYMTELDLLNNEFYSKITKFDSNYIRNINIIFNENIKKIIRKYNNIFKYENEYNKENFNNFIEKIKELYKVEITHHEIDDTEEVDYESFLRNYKTSHSMYFEADFLTNLKKRKNFSYKIPACSIESEFYKKNKELEVGKYNISIPYKEIIINYNVEHIYHYNFLLETIFYVNNGTKYYISQYTKHQILWALIQNTFLIFNEIINILLHYLSKGDRINAHRFEKDYFIVEYKLGLENPIINEIFIDIKNMNIVFNNLIFIFIIPRLMLISKIYKLNETDIKHFQESNPIKLYYFEKFF